MKRTIAEDFPNLSKTLKTKLEIIYYCYKELKFLKKEIESPDCPFGEQNINLDKCLHCRWFGEDIIK